MKRAYQETNTPTPLQDYSNFLSNIKMTIDAAKKNVLQQYPQLSQSDFVPIYFPSNSEAVQLATQPGEAHSLSAYLKAEKQHHKNRGTRFLVIPINLATHYAMLMCVINDNNQLGHVEYLDTYSPQGITYLTDQWPQLMQKIHPAYGLLEQIAVVYKKYQNGINLYQKPTTFNTEVATAQIIETIKVLFQPIYLGENEIQQPDEIADQMSANVQQQLGLTYYYGRYGFKQNYSEALKWFQKAAEQGHAGAQYGLGIMYFGGRGVPKQYAKALKWLQNPAEQGHLTAQYLLGLIHFRGHNGVRQNYPEALKWFQKVAKQGHADAQYLLGRMYYKGYGIPKDYAKALQCFQEAANQGHIQAQSNMGTMHLRGHGVQKNYAKALEWFQNPAEQGHPTAQYHLGFIYSIDHNGVGQNYPEALKWFQKAAKRGHTYALYSLGVMYLKGRGVPEDLNKAYKFFKKAAEQGHLDALFNLGLMYLNGDHVQANHTKALELFQKLAEQGHMGAIFNLALMYYQHDSSPRNYNKAYQLFQRAAKHGHLHAQQWLATMYLDKEPLGIPKNERKDCKLFAAIWLEKSAKQDKTLIKKLKAIKLNKRQLNLKKSLASAILKSRPYFTTAIW